MKKNILIKLFTTAFACLCFALPNQSFNKVNEAKADVYLAGDLYSSGSIDVTSIMESDVFHSSCTINDDSFFGMRADVIFDGRTSTYTSSFSFPAGPTYWRCTDEYEDGDDPFSAKIVCKFEPMYKIEVGCDTQTLSSYEFVSGMNYSSYFIISNELYGTVGKNIIIKPTFADSSVELIGGTFNNGESTDDVTLYYPASFLFSMPSNDVTVSLDAHAHTTLTLVEGVDPTCVDPGYKDAYVCTCGKYFADESGSIVIGNSTQYAAWCASGNGKINATGIHNTTLVEGKEASYTEAGYLPAYYDETCGTYFEDEAATIEIGDASAYAEWKTNGNGLIAKKVKSSQLSGGAIVGITAGSVVGVSLITYIILFIIWLKKKVGPKFLFKSFEFIAKLFAK